MHLLMSPPFETTIQPNTWITWDREKERAQMDTRKMNQKNSYQPITTVPSPDHRYQPATAAHEATGEALTVKNVLIVGAMLVFASAGWKFYVRPTLAASQQSARHSSSGDVKALSTTNAKAETVAPTAVSTA